jgi:hypothetical protein
MALMVAEFSVKDYATWRRAFDAYEAKRVASAITNPLVYRNADATNDLLVLSQVADVPKARQMMSSDDLRKTMQDAGVLTMPRLYFIE